MTWPASGPAAAVRRLVGTFARCVFRWCDSPELGRFREWHRTDPASLHAAIGLTQNRCSWCRPNRTRRA